MTDFGYQRMLDEINASRLDIRIRELKNGVERIAFLFVLQLVDRQLLADAVIRPLSRYIRDIGDKPVNAEEIADSVICNFSAEIADNRSRIIGEILKGMVVAIFSHMNEYIVMNTRKVENRGVESPELTFTLRGPRDSLNENLDVSLSLIRYRIKDPRLDIEKIEVGRRTRTNVAVLHISDIANGDIVKEIIKRIKKIDVDGIVDSGELQNLILNRKDNLFPQMGVVERSDMAAGALLEGKTIVLVEGSALAIVGPKVFSEFFETSEDNYDNPFIAVFAKYIRLSAVMGSLAVTALYVAIINFHSDALPANFLIFINNAQQGVPLSIFVGALILELIVEMIREAMIRVPRQIGPAIGIVATIVIGQAVILAKVFSPLNLVIASLSFLSSFAVPDYTIMNPIRIVKFLLIILSGAFGLVGFTIGMCMLLMNIVSANTFGLPYFAPFAPFNSYDVKNTVFFRKKNAIRRPHFLKTKDKTRKRGY